MIDINTRLFKINSEHSLKEFINSLSNEQLLGLSDSVFSKIIKMYGSIIRKGHVRLDSIRKCGNNNNSNVTSISLYGNNVYVDVTVSYYNTYADEDIPLREFLINDIYIDSIPYRNKHGDAVNEVYTYNIDDKINVVRSILLDFLDRKYDNIC